MSGSCIRLTGWWNSNSSHVVSINPSTVVKPEINLWETSKHYKKDLIASNLLKLHGIINARSMLLSARQTNSETEQGIHTPDTSTTNIIDNISNSLRYLKPLHIALIKQNKSCFGGRFFELMWNTIKIDNIHTAFLGRDFQLHMWYSY